MKSGTDIHGPQRMNLKDFGFPLNYPLAPPAGQIFTYLVKYLKVCLVDLDKMWYTHSWSPKDESK